MIQKTPKTVTHGIVNRVQNSLFGYQGWPSVARDENKSILILGSLYTYSEVMESLKR